MTPEKFKQYADQGYSKIPLMKTILADLETPLSAYMKLANGPYSYLFESVQGGENWGRYSIIGLPCNEVIKITGNNIRLESNGRLTNSLSSDAPLDWVRQYASTFNIPDIDGLPRFSGGLVGYFGYETIHYIEPKVAENSQQNKKEDPIGSPDILLMISEEVLIFDNVNNQIMIVTHVDPTLETAYQDGLSRLEELSLQLNTTEIRSTFGQSQSPAIDESGFVSGFTQEG